MEEVEKLVIVGESTVQKKGIQCSGDKDDEQQLLNTLMQFYKNIRNPSINKICNLEKQFIDSQKKIIKVVEFRKNLQKCYQIDEIKVSFIEELMGIRASFVRYEDTINHLVKCCHKQQCDILKLQTQLLKTQSHAKNQMRKGQSSQLRSFNRINESIKQLKTSVQTLTLSAQHRQPKTNQQCYPADEIARYKQSLRNKQIAVESKMKLVKIKQQMIMESQNYNKNYMDSLKQSMMVYETVMKCNAERKLRKEKIRDGDKQIQMKQEKLEKLCRMQLAGYEKQLLKLKEIIEYKEMQMQNLINDHKLVEESWKQNYERMEKKLRISIAELKEQNQRINEQMKNVIGNQEEELVKIKDEQNRLLEQIRKKDEQMAKLNQVNHQINEKNKILTTQKYRELASIKQKEQQKSNLLQTIKVLHQEQNQLRKKQKYQLDSYEQEINKLMLDIFQMQKKYQEQLQQNQKLFQRQIDRYRQIQNQLKINLQQVNQINANLHIQVEMVKNEIAGMLVMEESKNVEGDIMEINNQHLAIIKGKIEEEINKQWEENNKQMETMLDELCSVMKNMQYEGLKGCNQQGIKTV